MARVCRVDGRSRWGTAEVLEHAQRPELDLHASVGDKISLQPRSAKTLRVGQKIRCFVAKHTGQGDEQWFARSAWPFDEEKSQRAWGAWQVGMPLPNTVHGADHGTGWGLACWKCGHAKVPAEQFHQIKNASVWTNTDRLAGTKLHHEKVHNRYKRCDTQNVLCALCSASIGSLYKEPYYDDDTKALTTSKTFPCVKLTTAWTRKESGTQRYAMVVTGPSKFEVEDILAAIPQATTDNPLPARGRMDAATKKIVLQQQAHQAHAARQEDIARRALHDSKRAEARVEVLKQKLAQEGVRLQECCVCEDEVPICDGACCGGWISEPAEGATPALQAAGGTPETPGATAHFTCSSCLDEHLRNEAEPDKMSDDQGRVYCPGRSESGEKSECFGTPLKKKLLAKHCSEEAFEAYDMKLMSLRERACVQQLELSFEERVKKEAAKWAKLSKMQKEVGQSTVAVTLCPRSMSPRRSPVLGGATLLRRSIHLCLRTHARTPCFAIAGPSGRAPH